MTHSIGNYKVDLLEDTFVNIVRLRAMNQPDKIAFSFLADRSEDKVNVSYSELDAQSRNIAAILQKSVSKGERAILLYPSGKDYVAGFLGSLYAGVVAVPAYPPDPTRLNNTLKRLQTIIDNSQAKIALTTSQIYNTIKKLLELKKYGDENSSAENKPQSERTKKDYNELQVLAEKMINSLIWIQTDTCEKGNENAWMYPEIKGDSIAYLQYTSGSTGAPNGVIVSHRNILVNSKMIASAFETTEEHEGIIWLPMYHDMGLIGGILQPLFTGFKCTLMSPLSFLAWPSRWLKEISKCSGNVPVVSGGPNFAYELCTKRITPDQIKNLDLSRWAIAFSGSEPVRWKTIEEFSEKFAPAGFKKEAFYPCYGMAEATLFVSGIRKSSKPTYLKLHKKALERNIVLEENSDTGNGSVILVGCGYAREDGVISIVDPETKQPCPEDGVGEIWFSSHSVAKGYWNKPDESNLTFNQTISGKGNRIYLRTGDLGFVKDNQLYITGRLKDVIIIRGKNHYPQDIEYTVEKSLSAVRQSCLAAFSVEKNHRESLVIVAEVSNESNLNYEDIFNNINNLISSEHELQVSTIVLIKQKTILKTSSGKIQRRAVRNAFLKEQLEIVKLWQAGDIDNEVMKASKIVNAEESITDVKTPGPENTSAGGKLPDIKPASKMTKWIINNLASKLKVSPSEIDPDKPFFSYGIDSVMAVEMASELESFTGKKISPTIVWEYSTISKLVKALDSEQQEPVKPVSTAKEQLNNTEQVAVIGMACRLPGVRNPQEFWNLLVNGSDAISEIPKDRWNVDEFFNEDPDSPGKMSTRWGGFVKDIDKFDANFFGISPREALQMDPQQRQLLEVLWEAFENGSVIPNKLAGSRTGVFIGISNHDYSQFQFGNFNNIDVYTGTGNAFSISANRISYLFDFRGPSMAVDTACSSSLVAAHLALQSLQRKESDLAIVGGVNALLCPDVNIALSKGRMLSPDGHCKTFDADANGYVRSEGCGILILKRLSEAIKDNNNILAVLRGSAVNQDGRSNGLTAPNKTAQQEVIKEALRDAGVTIDQVGYIEAHGTGTILGDPIEIDAINNVFKSRISKNPLILGSVKTNIGHLESAAGIAGLIKVILMLKHQTIPANLNFKKLNPHIELKNSQIQIASEYRKWENNDGKRIAGVSSFGFGGVNAHVLLEEYLQESQFDNRLERPRHILTASARDENTLIELARKYHNELSEDGNKALADLCYSANTGRFSFDYKMAVTGKSKDQFLKELQHYINKESSASLYSGKSDLKGKPRIAFLFTGQGAQYVNMAKTLYETHPLFKEAFDTCNEILKRHLDKSLLEVIFSNNENSDEINNTAYTQPALFVIQYALSKLWVSWGVKADYLIGHSIGEYAAACIAEVFNLEDALMLVSARGRLMQSLPKIGEMAAVFADVEYVEKVLLSDFRDRVSIAGVNGLSNTVISGESSAIRQIVQKLNENNIRSQFLKVSHAFHSPLMDPILDEFEAIAGQVEFNPPRIPVISNLTGDIIARNQIPDSRYWRDHIRKPVLFAEGMYNLARLKTDIFIEIGPNPTLIAMARNSIPDSKALWVASLKKGQDDWKTILDGVAKLYVKGVEIDWKGFDHYYNRRHVFLPNYPFKKERFWTENTDKTSLSSTDGHKQEEVKKLSPLVHERLLSPLLKETVFSSRVQLKNFRLLDDHRIFGVSLMPMMGFIEMLSAIISRAFNHQWFRITNLNVIEAMIIPQDALCNIQVVLGEFVNSVASFQVYSASSNNKNIENGLSWQLNAAGEVHLTESRDDMASTVLELSKIQNHNNCQIDIHDFYSSLQSIGFEHGQSYRVLRQISSKENEALGYCSISDTDESLEYVIHPGLLDAGIQLFLSTFNGADVNREIQNDIYLPSGLGVYNLYRPGEQNLWVRTIRKGNLQDEKDNLTCDVLWYNEHGELIAEAIDLRLKRTTTDVLIKYLNVKLDDLLYKVEWIIQEHESKEQVKDDQKRNWIVFSDQKGLGEQIISRLSGKGDYCYKVLPGENYKQIKENCFEIRPESPEDFQALTKALYSIPENTPDAVVYLWGLDEDNAMGKVDIDLIERTQNIGGKAVLYLIQKMLLSQSSKLTSLWLITPGCHKVIENDTAENFSHSIAWGIVKVLSNEHPDIFCVMIDILQSEINQAANQIIKELNSNVKETQIAFRENKRYVARLIRGNKSNADLTTDGAKNKNLMERLEISQKGTLSNLFINKANRQDPLSDEIEIEVKASGLNFRDVINALGLYPGDAGFLGGECSGIVSKIGSDVKDLHVGDEVMGIVPGSFSNYAITKSQLVVAKPVRLDFAEAATIPIAFLTAYYALNKLAAMSEGDKVLIHSASGGVGLAAVQLAWLAKAEIFATAGSDEKRDYLRSLGIKYIMNSRELDFACQVLNYTEGKGINIVLNSLNEEYIPKGLSILAPGGNFLEIGKVGIWDEEKVSSFRNDIHYFTVALDDLSEKNPSLVHSMLEELKSKFETGELKPLRTQRFLITNAEDAFRLMMKAKHIGKIVIEQEERKLEEISTNLIANHNTLTNSIEINHEGSYLITGGLGALGLELAGWLARKQAGQIILLSRDEPNESSRAIIKGLIAKGADVITVRADITDFPKLEEAFINLKTAFPIRGIIHGAGMLDDGILRNQTWDKFETVMNPKVKGAVNLYRLFNSADLDFVLYMSSIAPILGSPGQANYASANSFLDSFSAYQRKLGKPAFSINWGPWKEKGMSKKMNKSNYAGIKLVPANHALLILNKIFSDGITTAVVMSVNWEDFAKNIQRNQLPTLYSENIRNSELKEKDKSFQKPELVTIIENTLPAERKAKMIEFIQKQTLSVLGLASDTEIDIERPLQEMGMDSLMAIELKNHLTGAIGRDFPVTAVFNYPSIEALSVYILREHLHLNNSNGSQGSKELNKEELTKEDLSSEEKKLELDRTLKEIEDLSDKDVEELLLKKLNQKDEDLK